MNLEYNNIVIMNETQNVHGETDEIFNKVYVKSTTCYYLSSCAVICYDFMLYHILFSLYRIHYIE